MSKPTIASVVQEVSKNKPVSIKRMVQDINNQYPELGVSEKCINQFLYNEAYNNTLYGSCERFEKVLQIE